MKNDSMINYQNAVTTNTIPMLLYLIHGGGPRDGTSICAIPFTYHNHIYGRRFIWYIRRTPLTFSSSASGTHKLDIHGSVAAKRRLNADYPCTAQTLHHGDCKLPFKVFAPSVCRGLSARRPPVGLLPVPPLVPGYLCHVNLCTMAAAE